MAILGGWAFLVSEVPLYHIVLPLAGLFGAANLYSTNFQLENFLAMRFTTLHDLYWWYLKNCVVNFITRKF